MKPAVSRIVCAAAALADISATELASKTGLSLSRVSQIRSGVRGDTAEVERLLATLHVQPEALIKHLGRMDTWGSRDAEETLAALLLSFDPDPPLIGTAPARVTCDRLSATFSPTSRGTALIEEFFAKARTSVHSKYTRTGRYAGIWIGDGLKWRGWRDTRVEFNPALLSPAGTSLVARIFSKARDIRFTRVDIAVDLPVSLRAVQAIGTLSRRACGVWSDSIEAIYVGEKNAARSFAIYDKQCNLFRRGDRSPLPDDLTRFEARRKKLKLAPAELHGLENPFRVLQLLWLGGEHLSFIDRLLVRFARLVGFPLVMNELSRKRADKLRDQLAAEAKRRRVPHPRDAYDELWKAEAERVLDRLGLNK